MTDPYTLAAQKREKSMLTEDVRRDVDVVRETLECVSLSYAARTKAEMALDRLVVALRRRSEPVKQCRTCALFDHLNGSTYGRCMWSPCDLPISLKRYDVHPECGANCPCWKEK